MAQNREEGHVFAMYICTENPDGYGAIAELHIRALGTFGGSGVGAWEAAMVCPLVENAPLPEANRLVGRPIWPSAFDLA